MPAPFYKTSKQILFATAHGNFFSDLKFSRSSETLMSFCPCALQDMLITNTKINLITFFIILSELWLFDNLPIYNQTGSKSFMKTCPTQPVAICSSFRFDLML